MYFNRHSLQYASGTHHSPLGAAEYLLLHADALRHLLKVLEGQPADVIVTDIPYGGVSLRPSNGLRWWVTGRADLADFCLWSVAIQLHLASRGWVVVFCGWRQLSTLVVAFEACGLTVRVVPLIKTNPSPVTSQHGVASNELCVIAAEPGAPWYGTDVLQILRAGSPRRVVNGIRAMKSARLLAHLIRHITKPGDLVVDPFMGIGTTGEAAIQHGRRFLGIDRDPAVFAAAAAHLSGLKAARTAGALLRRYPPLL
jgi:site-specific DNA-methyltransferase (adenine-specific)